MALEPILKALIDGQLDQNPDVARLCTTYAIGTDDIKHQIIAVLDMRNERNGSGMDIVAAIREVEGKLHSHLQQANEDVPQVRAGSIHSGGGGQPGKIRGSRAE